ncbi:hypothetical protein [Candidatus Phycosocius spiralis]|uniref:Uncharacterized protein n=1 Tax=Candidatus Phycosocius spiralis TaxID=2815099 RepID=A0ABQ4PYC6_9PROT|nr:hypothetical protein [Candidatus Phycosocius spiralis]GIU68081.1 hypothetical protein PsB1_2235 [Candidatus Phycosocius spiralis]
MRALTVEELEFVSGGEADPPIIVTGKRNPVTPGWGVIYPDDLAMWGLDIMDFVNTGEFVLTGGGGSSSEQIAKRQAEFLRKVKVERLANNMVRITFNRDVTFSAQTPLGNMIGTVKAGSTFEGPDKKGGPRGANGIPDVIDGLLAYDGGVTWR